MKRERRIEKREKEGERQKQLSARKVREDGEIIERKEEYVIERKSGRKKKR